MQQQHEAPKLKIAFLHPDLGIGDPIPTEHHLSFFDQGGAERLIVDTALGLQRLGNTVDIYTSHHDVNHCFEETRDGTLNIRHVRPPVPRSIRGKGHILFAHLRQLHLTLYLLLTGRARAYDVYLVDQLSTCIPFLRGFAGKRVVFYGHFPDKLLADGQFVEGMTGRRNKLSIKGIYRLPMDWLEEVTTRQTDILLVNSKFTARVFKEYFPSITHRPRIVYPGINIDAYGTSAPEDRENVGEVFSDRPTLLSLNRFEKKKNAALSVEAFAIVRKRLTSQDKARGLDKLRLVLAGGFDPRLQDNIDTLNHLTKICDDHSLTYLILPHAPTPSSSTQTTTSPDVTLVLNFTTTQRTWLLTSPATRALLYTPTNEHFGIIPVEGMISALPVLACDSGGPTESIVDPDFSRRQDDNNGKDQARTGWLRAPDPQTWSDAILEILRLSEAERTRLGERARRRAVAMFSLDTMSKDVEQALQEAFALGNVEIRPLLVSRVVQISSILAVIIGIAFWKLFYIKVAT